MFRLTMKVRFLFLSTLSFLTIATILFSSVATPVRAAPVQPHFNWFLSHFLGEDDAFSDNDPIIGGIMEQNSNLALPNGYVTYDQVMGAYNASQTLAQRPFGLSRDGHSWQSIGPNGMTVPGTVTFTGAQSINSGRVTALAVSSSCTTQHCRIFLGAAGGGVWKTEDGLADQPHWRSISRGLASNAIGSITIDPTDQDGNTIYVGTGEPNGASDAEAGVGLYKSTNGGETWQLLAGSIPAAKDRGIGSIAVDPIDSKHLFIGTTIARHGSASVIGGRFTPPGAPQIGLYESWDGGRTFKLVFSKQSDVVNPGTANGNDFFRGGVTKVEFNRLGIPANQPSQVYFSMEDYGLFRSNSGSYEQVFASSGGGTFAASANSRTEFDLAPNNGHLRIYLVDSGAVVADTYRVDEANVAAATLTDGVNNPGWIKLSNPTPGTAGFSSYNFCTGQCWYDIWVASPPGHPDTVWIGGSMQYNEIFTNTPPSNGRAVQRSTDAGIHFTDMTDDMGTPSPFGMHPDQHAVGFASSNPDIAILGSDGGVVRTSGQFADASSQCAGRGISGTDLTNCQMWLSTIPTKITSMNVGLQTLQFQSLTVNPSDPQHDVIGGTQDNGTLAYTGNPNTWFESVGGDGGQSTINVTQSAIRMHTFFGPNGDVNFNGTDPLGWDFMAGPLQASGEAASFYVPLISDPVVGGTDFIGLEHVWRTQDNGGNQAFLDANCSELINIPNPNACGDWQPLGPSLVGTAFGTDKAGNYVVNISRAPSNHGTMWVATRRGRLFISTNADAAAANVSFTRLDTAAQPTRFISGIAIDPKNPFHAFVSFSGYSAYTPNTPGHVFDVTYDPTTGTATWKDISQNLGDQPVLALAYDGQDNTLYAGTSFGVLRLNKNGNWDPAATGLPAVAVYGLTLSESGRVLYAATHGRGAWRLNL